MLQLITLVNLMSINYSRQGCNFSKVALYFVFISFTQESIAQVVGASPDNNSFMELRVSEDKGVELHLEVRQMSLGRVLENIVTKTKVPIHYSVLPSGVITATCVGSTLKQVLTCLLDRKADLIVRNNNGSAEDSNSNQIVEAWILGSFLGGVAAKEDCHVVNQDTFIPTSNANEVEINSTRIDELLKSSNSNNPEERAQAMSGLIAGGRKDDLAIKTALEQGLIDQNEMVRAQAISSFSRREGASATVAIQNALSDPSVQVRLMAVDGITDDAALLQQAINDSDESVRSLALTKLEALTNINK